MIIRVTQADIDAGWRSDIYRCPIAQALNRAGFALVSVGERIEAVGQGQAWSWGHSPTTRSFMRRFDTGQDVQPFDIDTDKLPSASDDEEDEDF